MQGLTPEAFAEREATRWREGLDRVGPDRRAHRPAATGRRIRRLHAGQPCGAAACRCCEPSKRLPPPSSPIPSSLAERASAAATSVLTLAGIDAEPLRSREHILLSTLLQRSLAAAALARPRRRSSRRCNRRQSSALACSSSSRSIPLRIASSWRWISTGCWRRPTLRSGSKAIRSTSTRCSTRPPANRASPCCRLPTSTIASACSSSRWCSTSSFRGCACSAARRRCGRWCTSTR